MSTLRKTFRALIAGLLAALALPAAALERFSYCGTLQVTGGLRTEQGPAMPMLPMMGFVGGYVGALGVTPLPPRTCVYVTLGKARGGRHLPAIAVWSDMPPPVSYHADIYSDPEGIFGHRQRQPSDYEPSGIMNRTREMERYLDAAAGEPVLLAVLDALRQGRERTSLDREIVLPTYGNAGPRLTVPVRYELTEIRADARFPEEIRRLIALGRERRHPHSPDWRPIAVPADKVPR